MDRQEQTEANVKSYKGGALLSAVLLAALLIVNDQLYRNVMNLSLPITLVFLHVIIFKYLIPEKKYIAYSIFLLVLAVAIYFALPALTQQEAQVKVMGHYNLEQVEATTVPTSGMDSWNPFEMKSAYFFRGQSQEGEDMGLLVNPANGTVFLSEPSEGFGGE